MDLRPTTTCLLLWQLCILLIVVGALLHQYEYFAGAFAIIAYLMVAGVRFQRQVHIIRPSMTLQRRLDRDRGHVGGTCRVHLEISNMSSLALHVDRFEDNAVLNGSELKLVQPGRIVLGNQPSSIQYDVELQRTGVLNFVSVNLCITDDRRLYQSIIPIPATGRLEVVAPYLVSEMQLTPMQLYGGAPEQRRIGPAGTDYAATRAYIPGDELRRIDWKATARLNKLMVREFHAEVSSPVIALLDAGPSMSQPGFVSSRFEEGLAVAQLVAETALNAGDPFGFGIFDQKKLREHWLPELSQSRLQDLRRIALEAKTKPPRGVLAEPRMPITPRSIAKRVELLDSYANDSPLLYKLTVFLRNARLLLSGRFRRTGPYKALRAVSDLTKQAALIIVLTDLQADLEGLLEGVRYSRSRGHRTIIAQIASPWRLEEDLETAYVEYESNRRIIDRLREEGALVLDTRPEQLLGSIAKEISFGRILGRLKE